MLDIMEGKGDLSELMKNKIKKKLGRRRIKRLGEETAKDL